MDAILMYKSYFLYKSKEYEKGLQTVDLIKFIDVDYVCAKSMILISQNKFDEALNVIKKHISKIQKRRLHNILSLSAKRKKITDCLFSDIAMQYIIVLVLTIYLSKCTRKKYIKLDGKYQHIISFQNNLNKK